eukprot:scaffold757_cov74-Cylindrotheca_fusiformis.AAC.3
MSIGTKGTVLEEFSLRFFHLRRFETQDLHQRQKPQRHIEIGDKVKCQLRGYWILPACTRKITRFTTSNTQIT